jgi:hypothetical protein
MPLTDGWIRILLFSSLTFQVPDAKKTNFSAYFFLEVPGTFTSFLKDKKVKKKLGRR